MLKKLTKEKLNEILERAIDEFADKGPDKASVGEIAKKARVSVGVLYKYYANKDALFNACVEYALAALEDAVQEAMREDESFFDTAERMIKMALRFSRENPRYHVLYHEISSRSCAKYAGTLAKRIEGVSSEAYTRLLERAQRDGEVRADMDIRLIAFFFDDLLMMLQFSYSCTYYKERLKIYCGGKEPSEDEMAETLLAFLRSACRAGER